MHPTWLVPWQNYMWHCKGFIAPTDDVGKLQITKRCSKRDSCATQKAALQSHAPCNANHTPEWACALCCDTDLCNANAAVAEARFDASVVAMAAATAIALSSQRQIWSQTESLRCFLLAQKNDFFSRTKKTIFFFHFFYEEKTFLHASRQNDWCVVLWKTTKMYFHFFVWDGKISGELCVWTCAIWLLLYRVRIYFLENGSDLWNFSRRRRLSPS